MMRPRFLAVGLLAGALACSDSASPGAREFSDINGPWTFTLTKQGDCFGLQGDLFAELDFSGDETIGNTVSTWTNDRAVPDRFTLIGNVNLETGVLDLNFWHTMLEVGLKIEGEIAPGGTFTGRALDPVPGGYEPYLSCGCVLRGGGTAPLTPIGLLPAG